MPVLRTRLGAENNRIYSRLMAEEAPSAGEPGDMVSPGGFQSFLAWLCSHFSRFWPSVSTLALKQPDTHLGRVSILPANVVLGKIHNHAYLCALLTDVSFSRPCEQEEINRVSQLIWPGIKTESALRALLAKTRLSTANVSWQMPRVPSCNLRCLPDLTTGTRALSWPRSGPLSHQHEEASLECETSRVVETFDGRVEKIEGGIAYISLKNSKGQMYYGEADASDLAADGIRYPDCFRCEIKKHQGRVTLNMSPLPRRALTEDDYTRIEKKIDVVLGDCMPGDL